MRTIICFLILLVATVTTRAQMFMTRTGYIGFFSKTPLEDIKAENRQVYAVVDAGKKSLAFTCLVKGFLFRKDLMQQHFNENYIESDKYPKANFTGVYTGDVNMTKNGTYPVQVKGQLTLHGVTREIDVPGTIEIKNGNLIASSNFKVTPGDFNIKIPELVKEKIAKHIDVRVQVDCNPK